MKKCLWVNIEKQTKQSSMKIGKVLCSALLFSLRQAVMQEIKTGFHFQVSVNLAKEMKRYEAKDGLVTIDKRYFDSTVVAESHFLWINQLAM